MTIHECANEANRSWQTIRRWIDKYSIVYRKCPIAGTIYIDRFDWEKFCDDNEIERVER